MNTDPHSHMPAQEFYYSHMLANLFEPLWKTSDAKLLWKEAKRVWPVKVKAFKKGYKMIKLNQELRGNMCLYHADLQDGNPCNISTPLHLK